MRTPVPGTAAEWDIVSAGSSYFYFVDREWPDARWERQPRAEHCRRRRTVDEIMSENC